MKQVFLLITLCVAGFSATSQGDNLSMQIDIAPWSNQVAVFTEGRVKSYETFARSYMQYISGSKLIDRQPATFTFLDMMIRPEHYEGRPIIYVKNKNVRSIINDVLQSRNPSLADEMSLFMQKGLISKEHLQEPEVHAKLQSLRSDVMRFASPVEQIEVALNASNPRNMWANLQVVPPPSGQFDAPWFTMEHIKDESIISSWTKMVEAWNAEDASKTNQQLARLAGLLPLLPTGEGIYPPAKKLQLESLYFKLGNFTAIWIVYLIAVVLLLMAFVYQFKGVGSIGLWLFIFAASLHTVAVIWRWYVSGRYPNTNMFEAITTAAWMGSLFGLLMEFLLRKTQMKYLFALGASVASMIALLAVRLYPLELNPHVSNRMPVLHDIWLYIHVNFIIFSYCLIFVAAVTAMLYLFRRMILQFKGESGIHEFARAGGIASVVELRPVKKDESKSSMGMVLDGATMILVELSFILLWAGIVMGAIWADHSWGRPWGWDPKEVFALNTFIVFAVLIHTRMKVKDKGLWTALLAIIGCGVMLFNWIIINFTISGLHSYA